MLPAAEGWHVCAVSGIGIDLSYRGEVVTTYVVFCM